jgi:hypothetical protein
MQVIRTLDDARTVTDEGIRSLIERRIHDLSEGEPFDADTTGYFVVVQAGDTVEALNEQLGFHILCNRFDGTRFDEPGFNRSFEVLEEHRTCFEIVFVISDDGFGVLVFIPKSPGVPHDLQAMCAMHSVQSQEDSER